MVEPQDSRRRSGPTLSLARRLRLLDWAAQEGVWVIEDDYLSELQLKGRAERFRGQGRAGSTLRGRNGAAILRVACRGRGRRSRLCRSHRRDLEGLRSARACIRQHQPPRRRGRDGRIPDRLIDPAGGAARLRLFSFSFPPSFIVGGAGRRGDLPYNALSDSGVAYRLIQDCAPRSRRATLCA